MYTPEGKEMMKNMLSLNPRLPERLFYWIIMKYNVFCNLNPVIVLSFNTHTYMTERFYRGDCRINVQPRRAYIPMFREGAYTYLTSNPMKQEPMYTKRSGGITRPITVSYTHLTLPTICSV